EAAVLEGAAAAGRAAWAGSAGFARAAELVEAVEPVLAIEAREVGAADRRRVIEEPLLEARPGFGRGERLGFDFVAPQAGVERLGLGGQCFERFAPAGADNIVRILARRKLGEAQGALGADVGQGAQ